MEGYDAARKQLHQALSDRNWEYARIWEPHRSGYGHLHIAVFVEDDGDRLDPGDFEPVMRSHVSHCDPAGWEAHRPDNSEAISINRDVNNLGTYISEYIGIFGEEAVKRPISEQAFYATCWATGTRRVNFSNGAQELMAKEQFRRETGLRPEDRGGRSYRAWRQTGDPDDVEAMTDDDDDESDRESGREDDDESGWGVRSICHVTGRTPSYSDPTTGGVDTTAIAGREGVDRPRELPAPPPPD